jgi:hypothetical protein
MESVAGHRVATGDSSRYTRGWILTSFFYTRDARRDVCRSLRGLLVQTSSSCIDGGWRRADHAVPRGGFWSERQKALAGADFYMLT